MIQLLYSHLTPDKSILRVIGPAFEPLQALWEEGGHFIDLDWFL